MSTLAHDALIYEGEASFLEHMLPFVHGGLERDDAVLAVTSPGNIAALRSALGSDAGQVDFRDSTEWYRSPGVAFNGYAAYVDASDRPVRVIGEPVWPTGAAGAVREWAKYESVLNVAFADAPAWIVCPYDATSLPHEILDHARHTHPTLHALGGRVAHDEYMTPDAFWAGGVDAPVAPARARSLAVTPDLAALRAAVAVEAHEAGVPAERLPDLLFAVHELAINALTHGGGAARLACWLDGQHFVCELADDGPGIDDRYPGYRLPTPSDLGGRGIWLLRRLCDYVEIHSGADGTRVRVRVGRA